MIRIGILGFVPGYDLDTIKISKTWWWVKAGGAEPAGSGCGSADLQGARLSSPCPQQSHLQQAHQFHTGQEPGVYLPLQKIMFHPSGYFSPASWDTYSHFLPFLPRWFIFNSKYSLYLSSFFHYLSHFFLCIIISRGVRYFLTQIFIPGSVFSPR